MTYDQLIPRFLKYVKVETRSDETSSTTPSTQSQVAFLNDLAAELKGIGLTDVHVSQPSGYVFATLPSNVDKDVPTIGFISHVDTADFNAQNVNPQIVTDYDGESVINLDAAGQYRLDPAIFPSLRKYKGHTLITTDGTTLLGSDDKSGVAEIVTAAEYLMAHPEIKHGTIKFGLGPDEEIGTGADHFDVADFGADFAYTVDGGPLGQLEYETFNAADGRVHITGTNVHPGDAKDTMVNANQVAIDFHNALPELERPENTEGRQGFFHLYKITGDVDTADLGYIIRDHDRARFEARKNLFKGIGDRLNLKYGAGTVTVTVNDQYYNMREVIEKDMSVVELAKQAMLELGIKPDIAPVRGGTDGSKISFLGLPTPNIFAGGENMHGRFEYVSEQTMQQATDVILKMIELNVTD
ncbi:peptidase T [Secundilactobacillus odoratitofui DSM 19909 = JCM 15043]|uniref:Peptidase T n=1 Tax=Secundilactobacillus odoratitofui DSM 19909 = JCM 15043 TaxID=1423776 RepID=A0A0R1M0R7_9LACO|nr:peptidase T [Secundilactobacillus odoratitofui]KRK98130.1 peptidase T [Secundilactobacillus odoratitofui DSM 19909 = JCM 15043]